MKATTRVVMLLVAGTVSVLLADTVWGCPCSVDICPTGAQICVGESACISLCTFWPADDSLGTGCPPASR